jgi:MFS family permease
LKISNKYRWFVVVVFFIFILLHQSDKLLIGPLTPDIINEFNITKTQMGAVLTGALIIGTVLYPIWGYLYDRFARAPLLAIASFIWGSTTWLSAIVKTYPGFLATRASTGIDDSSYPGLYSLIADYFGPKMRGKIYGILQLSQPLGYLLGMLLALLLAPSIGWRSVFYITGSLGILLGFVILFGIKEIPRGKSEPELENIDVTGQYKFSWQQAREVFKKRSMWFIFLQGFAGVFPWNVITYWFFTYLAEERGYNEESILFTMAPIILILAGGYFVGGAIGDWLFKKFLNGRVFTSSIGVLLGAIFLFFAINTPVESRTTFFILMSLTALFMPLSSPNVISTVYDITLPEVRSTALAVEYFIENSGAALAPLLAGIIADQSSLKTAILIICISAWLLCFIIYIGALFFVPYDIKTLRSQLKTRAESELLVANSEAS